MKVELGLPNYARKAYLKTAIGVDTSDFAKRTGLANLKSDVDKVDIDKLKNVPSNLSKQINQMLINQYLFLLI